MCFAYLISLVFWKVVDLAFHEAPKMQGGEAELQAPLPQRHTLDVCIV